MHPRYLAFALPFFLLFIGLEYYYSKRKGKGFYHFAESVANLNVGIAERLMDIFTMLPFFYFFDYIYRHFALFHFTPGPWTWIWLFLATDLVWYWYHRLAHEVNIFWAAHIVHHQSEDYNYTVSARITVFQAALRCGFWAVLPLLGFPPAMISVLLLVHGCYPFFIHTQTIGKLGFLEYFLVTPSHHRVHHASNPNYLDKNYGDVLIIWDKIFGTFAREDEKPVYGLTKPVNSHSFLWQHFHYPLELLLAMKKAKGLQAKCRILFGRPGSIDAKYRTVLEKFFLRKKTMRQPTKMQKVYIVIQTALSLVLVFLTILFFDQLPAPARGCLSAFILVSLVNTGAIMEQRSWIFYLEFLKMFIVLLWIWIVYPHLITTACLVPLSVLLLYHFRSMERQYKNALYGDAAVKNITN